MILRDQGSALGFPGATAIRCAQLFPVRLAIAADLQTQTTILGCIEVYTVGSKIQRHLAEATVVVEPYVTGEPLSSPVVDLQSRDRLDRNPTITRSLQPCHAVPSVETDQAKSH